MHPQNCSISTLQNPEATIQATALTLTNNCAESDVCSTSHQTHIIVAAGQSVQRVLFLTRFWILLFYVVINNS